MSAINQLCNSKKYINFFIKFVGVVLISFTTIYSQAQCGAGDVGGTVFLDLPMNGSSVGVYGAKATNEPGVGGITIKITDGNGTITTKTTDATGKWYLDTPVFPVKIEFLWKTAYPAFESSPNGINSKTSVQIINSATCSADFALYNPFDYSQSNPNIVTTCFANGTSTGTAGTDAAIVSVKYNSTGLNAMYNNYLNVPGTGQIPNMDATINKVGSVYGVAYQRNKKRGFYSTFLKRHVGILDGTGYIYVLDHNTTPATYATKFNLQGLIPSNSPATTIDFGSVCRTAACGAIASDYTLPADKTQPSVDLDAFGKVGRVSMGDIDLGPDNNTLFVTNLNSNSIITVDVSGTSLPGTVKEYKVATLSNYPTSTKGSLHVFALEFYNGKGYLGVTDDASVSKLDADLKCYVLEFDPTNIAAGFIQKLVFNPNARKTVGNTQFHYWINSYVEPPVVDNGYFLRYTQPILSDIEFDQYGTMYLTLMDRFGHQIGQANHKPISGNTDYKSTQSFGELLKACDTSTGYVLEGNTGCAVTASEFFDDTSGDCSIESIVGSSLLLKGSDQIINTNFDPFSGANCGQSYWNTQGFSTRSTTLGTINNWYSVYYSGDTQLFGKANGLGDLEILASEAPIEIGNRIWKDINDDGIQDPSEPSLVGVTVKLYNSSDVEIASTTTDANGQYIFSSTTIAALLPNTNYKIKVTSLGINASVTGLSLTKISPAPGETAGNTNTGTTTDNSDAFLVSNIPTILIQTADAGENNHTYDFGFKCKPTAEAGVNKALNCTTTSTTIGTAAVAGDTYAWSPTTNLSSAIVANPTASPNVTTTYTLTVTSAAGCTATAFVVVTVDNTVPTVGITGTTNLTCSTTSVTRTASGGGSYLWSNGLGTSASVNITSAGTYTVTVTSANGCTATATTLVTSDLTVPQPVTASAEKCGEGTLTLSATGCGGTYNWYSSSSSNLSLATTASFTTPVITTTTLYYVSCTIGSCTSSRSVATATINEIPTNVTASSNSPIKVGNTVNLASTSTVGTNYSWTGPNNFTSIVQNPIISTSTELIEGVYTVTVSSPKGCTATATTNVIVFNLSNLPECTEQVTVTASSNSPIISGSAINLSLIATGAIDYAWAGPNGFTSSLQNPNITNSTPLMEGVYTVAVTVDGICKATATTNVIISCLVNPTANSNAPICVGGTLNLSASGGNSYVWSGPNNFTSTQQNPRIFNTLANSQGIYTVTLTGVGCTTTVTTNVVINALPVAEAGIDKTITCTTTSVQIGSDAVIPNTTYLWSPSAGLGATNASIVTATPTTTTTYTLTLANNLTGCTATDAVVVTVDKTTPIASITETNNLTCTASSVTRVASGGGLYFWSNNLGTSATAIISAAGTYTVTVTSPNGCTATATTNVTIDTGVPTVTITATEDTLTCSKTQSVLTTDIAPAGTYTYLWSNGSTASNISVNDAGTYSVEITAANGCKASESVIIVEFNTVTAQIDVKDVDCKGGNNGSITVTGFDGITPYKYKLSTGAFQSNNVFSGLTTGTYEVAIQDAGGCTASISVTVSEPSTSIALTLSPTNLKCNGATDGQIQATATGGTPAYTFAINGGTTQSNSLFTSLVAGTYTITATDIKGCSVTTTTEITQPTKLTIIAIGSIIDCSTPKGTITATVTGGTPAYQYSIDGTSFQPSNSFANLNGGTYTITVKDLNLCVGAVTAAITLADTVKPTYMSAVATMATCTAGNANNDGKITISGVVNGVSYQYSAGNIFNASAAIPAVATAIPSNGVLSSTLPNPTANSQFYTIRVFNSNGCYKDVTVELLKRVCDCKPEICVPVFIRKIKSK